jgi:hypothetical protein
LGLSLGGALIDRRPGLRVGTQCRIELFFDLLPDPLLLEALVVRETPTQLGIRCTDVEEAARVRLADILVGHQRRSATARTAA